MLEPLLTTDDLLAATSGTAWVEAMLAFERELAAAEAEVGLLPPEAAAAVDRATREVRIDPTELGREGRSGGNPVIPLVRRLRQAVGPELAGAVHLGATSQDVMDTALMLVARRGGALVVADLHRAAGVVAALAAGHRATVLAGRTLLQQALPTTLGLKAAGWLVGLDEAGGDLRRVLDRRLAVQLGGAAGTLASLGGDGPRVAAVLAGRLGLADPVLPWHADRVRIGELASALAVVAGAAAKVAADLTLLSQTEVGEVSTRAGGSSAMPHKQNPVDAILATAAARRATGLAGSVLALPAHEHERAAGSWHAEWPTVTELLRATGGSVSSVADALAGLHVRADRMRENLDRTGGVLMAERVRADLAPQLGWEEAGRAVDEAVGRALQGSATFAVALAGLAPVAAVRSPGQLADLCDPTGYLGAAGALIDRALAAHREGLATYREEQHG